jgi:Flp pilus assembly pilin Flp
MLFEEVPMSGARSDLANARTRKILRRFGRNRQGTTAVEFAIIATPLIGLIFAILETALAFWATQVLETATANAARLVYTGQFQTDHGTKTPAEIAAEFKKNLCDQVAALFDCNAMVKIDIREYVAFPAPVDKPIGADGNFDTTGWGYQPVGANKIVVVRAAMEYPIFVTLNHANQANLKSGNRLIMASAVFRTEPYK